MNTLTEVENAILSVSQVETDRLVDWLETIRRNRPRDVESAPQLSAEPQLPHELVAASVPAGALQTYDEWTGLRNYRSIAAGAGVALDRPCRPLCGHPDLCSGLSRLSMWIVPDGASGIIARLGLQADIEHQQELVEHSGRAI